MKPRPTVKRGAPNIAATLAEDAAPIESTITTTYRPSRHEAGWLLGSIAPFYEQNLIADVLYLVKGGKEANVYCCAAGPAAPPGIELLAAKVYRPRQFRNLRNDRMYREGRPVLTGEGRAVKATDSRILRALGKKTDFGVQVQHTSWLLYEYTTLQRLHAAGANVPAAHAVSDNAILMTYYGDRNSAAPTLSEASITPALAQTLFAQIQRTVESMLNLGLVHGDLSAYNILLWQNTAAVIDFPQVLQIDANPHASEILLRDLTRVCDYFSRQQIPIPDPATLHHRLWQRYGKEI